VGKRLWGRARIERAGAPAADGAGESPPTPDVDALVEIRGLMTQFFTYQGVVRAVDGIALAIPRGQTLCLVGESGSGKSATARSILQLVDAPGRIVGGQIWFRREADGSRVDLLSLDPKGAQMRELRGKHIAMIFQEPMSSLSPVHTIGDQIGEMLRLHEGMDKKAARARAIELLASVGITAPERNVDAYTFQLSGGMRQRAMIAMAIACHPQLLIADEPTTAVDVTTQAQILELLADLKERLGMTLMFITHDLGVVAEIADDVAVMHNGRIVEHSTVDAIFHHPQHPYTKALLAHLPQRQVAEALGLPGVDAAVSDEIARSTVRVAVRPRERAEEEDASAPALLSIEDLRMHFAARGRESGRGRGVTKAVDGVSLTIRAGETLGLVGESGCGKTTLGRCVLGAYTPTSGRIRYLGADGREVDLTSLHGRQRQPYRSQIRMIFQDPYGSLNPRMTVRRIIGEPLRASGLAKGKEVNDRVATMLELVGLKPDYGARYPHAFSGGERQRIGIARALITRPRLVVADEAVSALDVSVRSQVLRLLADLQKELDLTYIFVSHDLSVVETVCDRVAVMYFGHIVEQSSTSSLYKDPKHPYTQSLLSAVPIPDPRLRGTRERIIYDPRDRAEE
jgi:peptide/nickel transport system ATP-binding protein